MPGFRGLRRTDWWRPPRSARATACWTAQGLRSGILARIARTRRAAPEFADASLRRLLGLRFSFRRLFLRSLFFALRRRFALFRLLLWHFFDRFYGRRSYLCYHLLDVCKQRYTVWHVEVGDVKSL